MVQRKKFTQSIPLPKGTTYSVEVESESKYTPGRPNISQGVIEKDITIQATPATPTSLIITCASYLYQDILVSVYNNAGTQVTRIYSNTASISLPYNTKFSVKVEAHEGYIKSDLINIEEDHIYNLVRNTNISTQSDASPVMCLLVVEPTQHQTITVTTNNGTILESNPDDQVEAVSPYWTRFTSTIEADPGYLPGILNGEGEQTITKGNVNFTPFHPEDPDDESGYMTVRASSATENKHRLTIYKYEHQKIHAYITFEDETEEYTIDSEGAIESTSDYKIFEIFDSSIMRVSLVPDEGYQSIYPLLRYVDEESIVHTDEILSSEQEFTVDKNLELLALHEASIKYFTINLNQSRDEMIYLNSGEYEDITGSVNLKYGSTFTIRSVSLYPSIYKAGEVIATGEPLVKVSENNYTGTVTGDNTIYITPVTLV